MAHHHHAGHGHGFINTNISDEELAKLPEKERWRIEHQRLHEKHRGHEAMHMEMVLILIATLVVAQILLMQWKQRYFKSYQKATLLGMWVIPPVFCIKFGWVRFLVIWTIFSVITGFITFKATRKPLAGRTPRLVYKWFLVIYKISYFLGIVGYIAVMFTLLGLNLLLLIKPQTAMDFGLLLLYYGLYFGVVSRDFAEVCSDTMAAHIGYYTETGLPGKRLDPSVCGLCNNSIIVTNNDDAIIEATCKLGCDHMYPSDLIDWFKNVLFDKKFGYTS